MAIDWLGKIKGGINELEKWLEMIFVKEHNFLLVFDSERVAHFLLVNARLALFAWFLAEIKELWNV